MSKKYQFKIGLDIDGVLLDTMEEYLKVFNKDKGTNFRKEDITHYDFNDVLGVTTEEMYSYFIKMDFSKVGLCDPEAPKYTQKWQKKGHLVDLLTASSPETVKVKLKNLESKGIEYDNVMVIDKIKGMKGQFSKKYDVIIDDSTYQLEDIRNNGCLAICYDMPWNQDFKGIREKTFKGLDNLMGVLCGGYITYNHI